MRISCFTIHRIHKRSTHSILYLKGAAATLVEKVTVGLFQKKIKQEGEIFLKTPMEFLYF